MVGIYTPLLLAGLCEEVTANQSLQEVFAGLGFEECDDGSFEPGYQKVALYEDGGEYQHASIQMPNGAWRSKMGTAH